MAVDLKVPLEVDSSLVTKGSEMILEAEFPSLGKDDKKYIMNMAKSIPKNIIFQLEACNNLSPCPKCQSGNYKILQQFEVVCSSS